MRTRQSFAYSALILLTALPRLAQAQSIPNQIGPQNATGIQAYDPYGGSHEDINLGNGDLHLQIPLLSLPGRDGHNLSLALNYDSKIWNPHSEYDSVSGQTFYSWDYDDPSTGAVGTLGWRLNVPVLLSTLIQPINSNPNIFCYGEFILITEDGSKHAFFTANKLGGVRNGCYQVLNGQINQLPQYDIPIGPANDASYYLLDTSNASDVVIRAKNGTTMHFSRYDLGTVKTNKIEDTNGNSIIFQTTGFNISAITDSVGRSISLTWGNPNIVITYKDSGGTQRTITLALASQTLTPTFQIPLPQTGPSVSASLLSSITLPNNLTWNFQYDTFGELIKVNYPAGAYSRYAYTTYTNWVQSANPNPGFAADFRELTARYVCRSSSGVCGQEDATTYTPTVDGTKTNNQYMDVSSAISDRTRHQFSFLTSSQAFSNFYSMREVLRYHYQGQSTLLRTVQTDYTVDANGNTVNGSLPIRETTTLNDVSPVLIAKTEWDHSSGVADNISEERDYDFGSGAVGTLVRKKDYTWLAVNPINGQDYTSNALHILNRKASDQIANSAGSIIAQTQFEYDSFTEGLTASGAVQHDLAFGTSLTTRGNVTATKHWRNTDGVWLTTRNQYDDAGNVRKATDPLSHVTTIAYSDSWGNSACLPTGGSAAAYPTRFTNALNQVSSRTYNTCTGTISSSTDLNSQVTSFTYDSMDRVNQTNFPDLGQTTRAYNEASKPLNLVTTAKITTTLNLVSTVVVDGLGRETQSQLTSDPQGTDYTDTSYDALGRTATVSNPHRGSPLSTDGTTTYHYDALNRTTSVTEPDGSIISTSYTGNCSTVTDEASKVRKSCSDGLGRLSSVAEDPTVLNYQTSYTYDAIDNLTAVVQAGSRNRTFTYNSLSQLLTAANPESGTITYTYDNNGNVSTKTDARNVKTTYTYEPLNRNTQKSYSDGTPTANFYFDAAPTFWGGNEQNTVGRLVEATTNDTATEFSYDPLGRIAQRVVCTPLNCTVGPNGQTGQGWSYYYTYNLAGGVTQFNDGIFTWPQYFNQTYDGAGRVTLVTSTVSDAQHPATFFTADATNGFFPSGALRKATLGNGLTLSNAYNNRLQPCLIDVNNNGTLLQDCNASTPPGNVLDLAINYNAGSSDNGNVTGWNATGAQSFVRSYTYDSLNRVKTMGDTVTAQPCKGLSWTYDAWGNRTDQTVTSGTCGTFHNAVDTNNRFVGTPYQFDAAGNMIHDASHSYTYDAENRPATVDGGATASYIYDALGRRTKKTVGSSSYEYIYDNDGNIGWELLNGSINRTYIRSNGRLLAEYYQGTTYFTHQDHLGSTRLLTAYPTPTIVECDDYYPYGETNTNVGTCLAASDTTLKFTGKERDSESGLDNFGARYNSSGMGRFMSPDWSADPDPVPYAKFGDPQSLNLYTYARNNPMTLTDPDGHCWHGTQWLCNFGQRLWYGFTSDFGFKTHAQVIQSERDYLIRQQPEINGERRDYRNATEQQVQEDYKKVVNAFDNKSVEQYSPLSPGSGGVLHRDNTGKIHGDVPEYPDPRMSRAELQEQADELRDSIKQRKAEQSQYGEEGGHRERIGREEQYLRQIERKLGGAQ
jgi:RHS repeat-associated protein